MNIKRVGFDFKKSLENRKNPSVNVTKEALLESEMQFNRMYRKRFRIIFELFDYYLFIYCF